MTLSFAYVTATCNVCGEHEKQVELIPVVPRVSYSTRDVEKTLRREGWVTEDNGDHICPHCLDDERPA